MEDYAASLNQAFGHHRAGRLEDAEQIYQRILGLEPANAHVWHLYGIVALQQGRQNLGRQRIEKAIHLAPTEPLFLNHLCEAYRGLGSCEEVTTNVCAIDLEPSLAAAYNNLGMAPYGKDPFENAKASQELGLSLAEQGDLERARMHFERAIAFAPDLVDAYYNFGNLLYRHRRFVEAGTIYQRAIGRSPREARLHNSLGNALQAQGRLEEAVASFELASALAIDDPKIRNNLGNALAKIGRFNQAEACFREAIKLDASSADAFINLSTALKAQGNLGAAVASLEQALSINSEHIGALAHLALTLTDAGKLDEAASAYGRLLTFAAGVPEIHYNFGNLLYQQGKRLEAAESYRRAIALRADFCEAHNNLGNVLKDLGVREAIASFERAVSLKPDQIDLHVNLADALQQFGRLEEAAASYRRALELDTTCSAAYNGLGIILCNQHQLAEGRSCFERAIALRPGYFQALNNLGVAFETQGQFAAAMDNYVQALKIAPERGETYHNLGSLYIKRNEVEQAIGCFQRAIALDPTSPSPYNSLGSVFLNEGRLAQAKSCFERALTLKRDYSEAINNLGNVFKSQGYLSEALECYLRSWKQKPECVYAFSNYLFCLNYDKSQSDYRLSFEHRRFKDGHFGSTVAYISYNNDRDPERRLRVGMVSPDFGRHPIGYFVAPLLTSTDLGQMEYYCYSNRWQEDDVTERLRSCVHSWRSVKQLSDRELAELVRSDSVDILVDLAGHTAANRLGCFALRPAPVGVHWAGYCHSVPFVDVSIWDSVQIPEGEEGWFVEKIIRLPDTRWCYEAPDYASPVADPPLLRRGYATFGSFNNLTKVNAAVIELWSRVVGSVSRSHILLSWPTLADPTECERFKAAFAAHGIAPDRVELRPGAQSHAGVLGEYEDVDIALDPFPFSGCLTTCEALWMGVPVVTLPRSRPVSRQTQAFLTGLGRTEWVARDADDYVRIATTLVGDPTGLAGLRRGQRDRMRASPLCDGPRFARNFEAALRQIWRTWCASEAARDREKR